MFKRLLLVALVLIFVVIGWANLKHDRLRRRVTLIKGKAELRMAAAQFIRTGTVTNNRERYSQVWVATNTILTIGGTQYQALVGYRSEPYFRDGSLYLTGNQTFIWCDEKGRCKVVDDRYRVPLFPPGF